MTDTDTKKRDTLKALRSDTDVKFDKMFAILTDIRAAQNTEQAPPAPPPPIWMQLGFENEDAWKALPEQAQTALIATLDNGGIVTPDSQVVVPDSELEVRMPFNNITNSLLTGQGPYQPILYVTDKFRRSTAFDSWVKAINRLFDTRTGKIEDGARVVMKRSSAFDSYSIWNKELSAANRWLWDTPANVAKAIAKAKRTGLAVKADSWNATSRKRQFYRRLDNEDGSNAGKFDNGIIEYYMPKTGDGWLRLVQIYPVRKNFVYG